MIVVVVVVLIVAVVAVSLTVTSLPSICLLTTAFTPPVAAATVLGTCPDPFAKDRIELLTNKSAIVGPENGNRKDIVSDTLKNHHLPEGSLYWS